MVAVYRNHTFKEDLLSSVGYLLDQTLAIELQLLKVDRLHGHDYSHVSFDASSSGV